MQTPWEERYAQRTQRMQSSAIRELLKFTQLPDVISFAGGLPAPEIFPVDAFRAASDRVLQESGDAALQYSTSEGFIPLREMIADRAAWSGSNMSTDRVLITSGSQQALDLIGKIFINPGDRILVESPTYLGAIQAWNAYGAEYVAVPSDEQGMKTEVLEAALRTGPKLIYVLPNFQNPTGVTMALERRQQLVALADQYGVPIVEDDPYGQLRFEGASLPTVLEIDSQVRGGGGNVIYLSTFSKILAPGIRLAWVIAPEQVITKLVQAKQGVDLHTATLNQMVAYQVSQDGFLDRHIKLIRATYQDRRDLMLAALKANAPGEISWFHPEGGLFLWVTLPQGLDAAQLLKQAVTRRVAFVPGAPFHPQGGGENTLRLNFSNAKPDMIKTGIERLGAVIYEAMSQPQPV